jgi:hypothetical protein
MGREIGHVRVVLVKAQPGQCLRRDQVMRLVAGHRDAAVPDEGVDGNLGYHQTRERGENR